MGDVYRIIFGDFKKMGGDFAGKMGGMQVTQGMMLGIAIFMVIPIVMVVLTLTLQYPVNRWANIIVAIIFFGFVLIQLPTYPSDYDKFLLMVRLLFLFSLFPIPSFLTAIITAVETTASHLHFLPVTTFLQVTLA